MVIRSLYQPVYQREKKNPASLGGNVPKSRPQDGNQTFEDYLKESFRGEVVQKGAWFAPQISELSKKNLEKI